MFWFQNTAAPKNNYTNPDASTTYVAHQTFGRGGARGGFGSGNNRNGWGRQQFQRNNATGANDTPLGTPTRVSPVPVPPPAPTHLQSNEATRSDDNQKVSKGVVAEVKEGAIKSKKRKRKEDDMEFDTPDKGNGKVDGSHGPEGDGESSSARIKKQQRKEKKSEKEKKEKKEKKEQAAATHLKSKVNKSEKYKQEKEKRARKRQAKEAANS